MSDLCSQWIALCDRQALGDELSAQEAAFLARHGTSCPVCGAEAAVWRDLASLVDGSEHARAAPCEVPAAPASAPRLAAATATATRLRAWALAALAACAALGLVARELRGTRPDRSANNLSSAALTQTLPPKAPPVVRLALTSGGELEVDGRPAQPGAEIVLGSLLFARSGSACLLVEPGIRACLAQGSLVRVAELSASSRRLELRAGKLAASLAPQPSGQSFGIVTGEGTAIAIGTAFSVEIPSDGGPVLTRVMHGTVLVRGATGAEQRVGAQRVASMRGSQSALSASDEARERPLFEQAALCAPAEPRASGFNSRAEPRASGFSSRAEPRASTAPHAALGRLQVASRPAGAQVLIDDRPVGVTPLAVLLEAGEHVLVVSRPAGSAFREVVRVVAGVPLSRSFEDAPPATSPTPAFARAQNRAPRPRGLVRSPAPAPVRGPAERDASSASDLLSAARECSAQRDVEGALRSYRELFRRHGESSEALAARVAYGEMLLAGGRDADAALASFERYLVRGGPLAREASFGRARALRALGELADERAAVAAFLRDFPDGPLAAALRARQRTLSQP